MKKIVKYLIPFFTAAVLMTTPVFGSSLSGAELLGRFDRLYAVAERSVNELLDSAEQNAETYPDSETDDSNVEYDTQYNDSAIIVIIEDNPAYDAYTPEEDEGESPDAYNELGDYDPEPNIPHDPDPEAEIPPMSPVAGFAITSGINVRSESTFDSARTIVGTAPRGAVVRIEVFGYHDESDTFYQVSGSVLTVGASGNFSSAQQLALGRNFIRIKATYYDNSSGEPFVSVETAQLNRLPSEVRNQLERGLLLP